MGAKEQISLIQLSNGDKHIVHCAWFAKESVAARFIKIFQLYCATYLDLSKLSTLQQCKVFGGKKLPGFQKIA